MPSGDSNVHTRVTLPPPEFAPAPASEAPSSVLEPQARWEGKRAEEASLRATLDGARHAGDVDAERGAAIKLARHLGARETDLDEAVELGLAALDRGDDVELRTEVAAWLDMLGEHATAAMVLRKTSESGVAAAATMVRVGLLLARAGDAHGAAAALEDASKLDPSDATPLELRGALTHWAGDVVSRSSAARSFVDAAARRKAAGADQAEMDDLLRAVEADPTDRDAARAFEAALRERGKASAADHAARAHALAYVGAPRREALLALVLDRLASQSYVEALGCALDAGLDGSFSGEEAATFDGLLLRLGLLEALAARLEVRVEHAKGDERRGLREQLARLFGGPLDHATRAAQQHVRIVADDPACDESLLALREHAQTVDRAPLVEALVRGTAVSGDVEARVHCARALVILAEETLRDPLLAHWAYEQLRDLVASDARLLPLTAGLGDLDAAVRRLEAGTHDQDRPQWRSALTAALERDTHNFGLGRWLLHEELTQPDPVEARAELAAAARQRGELAEASAITAPLVVGDAPSELGSSRSASIAWVNAALAGDARVRARALERLAAFSAPSVGAVLLSCAADGLRPEGGRAVAEAACRVDPASVRAAFALADASIGAGDRLAASALEHALGAGYSDVRTIEALADALETLGEREYAVVWSQRMVALRPSAMSAVERLMGRIIALGNGARLMDALMWLLSQPLPAAELAPLVAKALDALTALDPSRAAPVARCALDTFGPRHEVLVGSVSNTAKKASDDALSAGLLLRRLATVAVGPDRIPWLLELAELRAAVDPDGALRALALAARAGAEPTNLAALAEHTAAATSGDGELWRLEVRAAALEAEAFASVSKRAPSSRASRLALDKLARNASQALRMLGAMRWDMAGDARGAIETWLHAARVAPAGGYVALGVDLAHFAGARPALEKLQNLIAAEKDPARAGAIAAEAARASLAMGAPAQALELAEVALINNPLLADAIELAERGAVASAHVRELSRVYETLGSRARGRFGRRAAHYRAARFFDQRGQSDLALRHAAQAFAAVPSEGGTFLQLARMAERAGDASFAVRTIEEVADASSRAAVRAGWLLRAAQVADRGEDGLRIRVDVLLKAAFLQPMPSTLALLGDAARDLLSHAPEERAHLQVRFSKASDALAKKLQGPDGARVGLAFTQLALELFDDADGAVASLSRALKSNADLEEYVLLVPSAEALARAKHARDVVTGGVALLEKPFSNVGVPALRLLGELARACGDEPGAARMVTAAAERETDDDDLVRRADAASKSSSGPWVDRFVAKVPAKRRIAAHRAFVEAERRAGRIESAMASLERIGELSPELRSEVDAELRQLYELAGRASELETRALRVAQDERAPMDVRVEGWLEVAGLREQRGEVALAAEALRNAAHLDPRPLERGSQLERVSALAGDATLRAEALNEIESRVAPDARPAVLRRLAQSYEEAGDLPAVEKTWQRMLVMQPDDEEADFAIEELLARQGDHTRLAQHLEQRAARLARFPERRDMLRVVRLRRVAILEQRLGLIQEASAELERVVAEWPSNESALRYLGDLLVRQGNWERAVAVYKRLAEGSSDEAVQSDFLLRAANAARRGEQSDVAESLVREVLGRNAHHPQALAILGDVARARGDHATVAQALVALAGSPTESADQRSDWLIEAAQAAARSGDPQGALEHARKAALLAPHRGATQLFARGLEYRLRRAGTPEQAKDTLAQLDMVTEALSEDDAALAFFLRAEALDAVQGGEAGLHYLEQRASDAAPGTSHALFHLALAERLAEQHRFVEALPHYEQALAGHTLGLRSPEAVSMAAAETAVRAERHDEAIAILEKAANDPSAREAVLKRLAQVAASAGDLQRARRALEDVLAGAPEDRAAVLASLGRVLFAEGDAAAGTDAFRQAIEAAPADSMQKAQLEAELGALVMRGEGEDEVPVPLTRIALDAPTPLGQLASKVAEAPPGKERTLARAALARAHLAKGDIALGESLLLECLAEGDVESGEQLAGLLERDEGRTADLLRVRRLQVEHRPGDMNLLVGLRNAALQDRNTAHARAIEHVLRAFDIGAGPLPPPPLSAQHEHPGMLQLLTRPSLDPIGEACALVWEGASSILARDAQSYALTGVERIAPGQHSALARLYELSSRLLGAPNVPLYARRQTGSSNPPPGPGDASSRLTGGVALLPTLSAMMLGDAREDSAGLRYALGQAFAATLPQSALLVGLPEADARVLWTAMFAAFGPPELGKLTDPAATRLVEAFWNAIPPRSQRRLQELLSKAPTDFDDAVQRSRQSGRRVGLFLCGDIGFVLRVAAAELGLPEALLSVDNLGELVAASPVMADLVRLAVSAEYADARFRPMPEGGPRATLSSGRFKIL